MIRFHNVWCGGQLEHYSAKGLFDRLRKMDRKEIITDGMAQTIASWWHAPGRPYSTRLSTMGFVDRFASIADFCDPDQAFREGYGPNEVHALRMLDAYLKYRQNTAQSGARSCDCKDCFEIIVGIAGDMCSHCDEAGCDVTDGLASGCDCEACAPEDESGDECPQGCTCDHCIPQGDCPGDCHCIFCIPGC